MKPKLHNKTKLKNANKCLAKKCAFNEMCVTIPFTVTGIQTIDNTIDCKIVEVEHLIQMLDDIIATPPFVGTDHQALLLDYRRFMFDTLADGSSRRMQPRSRFRV